MVSVVYICSIADPTAGVFREVMPFFHFAWFGCWTSPRPWEAVGGRRDQRLRGGVLMPGVRPGSISAGGGAAGSFE